MRSRAFGPVTSNSPMWLTSKSPAAVRTAVCSLAMPEYSTGIAKEHTAVRTAAGLFDVSHMGEFEVTGPKALDLIQFVTSNDASHLTDGQAQYSALTTPEGTAVD